MTGRTAVGTPARMVSVVLMVEGQGEQVLTTLELLAATVQGTLLTMLAIPTHSSLTTLILGTEMPQLPIILLTHRTIPTVLNLELQVPLLTSQHQPPPPPFPSTATRRTAVSPPARLSHRTTQPQCQRLGMAQCPRRAWA